jgi:hypothetical protein
VKLLGGQHVDGGISDLGHRETDSRTLGAGIGVLLGARFCSLQNTLGPLGDECLLGSRDDFWRSRHRHGFPTLLLSVSRGGRAEIIAFNGRKGPTREDGIVVGAGTEIRHGLETEG